MSSDSILSLGLLQASLGPLLNGGSVLVAFGPLSIFMPLTSLFVMFTPVFIQNCRISPWRHMESHYTVYYWNQLIITWGSTMCVTVPGWRNIGVSATLGQNQPTVFYFSSQLPLLEHLSASSWHSHLVKKRVSVIRLCLGWAAELLTQVIQISNGYWWFCESTFSVGIQRS